MCNPLLIAAASMAMQTASTLAQADAQEEAANRAEQMALDGLAKDRAAASRMYEQINESAQDEQAQRHTEMLIDKARLHAINAESGLAGATQDRMAQEVENNAVTDMATIEKNRSWKAINANSQSQARGTQAGVQLSGIRRPSALGVGLQIGGAALDAYRGYDAATRAEAARTKP